MNNRKLERRTCRRNWNINGRQRETLSVCLCHSLPLSLPPSVTNYSGQKCTINIKLICSHGNAQSVQSGSLGFNMHFEHKSWLRRICLWIGEEQQHRPQLATFTGRATMLQQLAHTHTQTHTERDCLAGCFYEWKRKQLPQPGNMSHAQCASRCHRWRPENQASRQLASTGWRRSWLSAFNVVVRNGQHEHAASPRFFPTCSVGDAVC